MGPFTFSLADLVLMYKERLDQLGIESQFVNSTRLIDQLLSNVPELEACHKGRDVLLAFNCDIGALMVETSKTCDAINLAKSAAIISYVRRCSLTNGHSKRHWREVTLKKPFLHLFFNSSV